ncbi:hypothetical protein ACFX1X_009042 [Malus domestica]
MQAIALMKELSIKLKEAGYVPDLGCVFYDVDEEQKEKILPSHMKNSNLRICVDCHNFAKLVSNIYGRQMCMRDKNRFNHIVGGMYSCGDYW